MRAAPLALILLAGLACRRGELQADAGGGGTLSFDAALGDGALGDRGSGAADGPPPTPDHNCGMTSVAGSYVTPAILVLVDQSVSDPAHWSPVIAAVSNVVVAHESGIDWGFYAFPTAGPACVPSTVPSEIGIPISPMNAAAVAAQIRVTGTDGGSSPIAAAIAIGADYLGTLGGDQPRFMLLVTDHGPTCAGTIETLSADATKAESDARTALRAAAAAGIKTMVMAPSTTADVGALDSLAEAGGLPRATGLIEFNTEQTLADQFETTSDANCVFGLSAPPPVPSNLAVTLDGLPVPRDTTHMSGWDYASSTNISVELFGDWCTRVIESASYQLTVLDGCPVPVPLP